MGTNQRFTGRIAIRDRCKRIHHNLDNCLSMLKDMHELYGDKDPKYNKFIEDYAGLLVMGQQLIEQFRIEMV